MACSSIDTATVLPAGSLVESISVELSASHTRVGDLTVKLRAPSGSVLALVERPQGDGTGNPLGDNGANSPFGDSSDLLQGFPLSFRDDHPHNPEQMGLGIYGTGVVCRDDGRCTFFPNPDQALVVGNSVANFAALNGGPAAGEWRLCLGDSVNGDTGVFHAWGLRLQFGSPALPVSSSRLPVAVRVSSSRIFANGFEAP